MAVGGHMKFSGTHRKCIEYLTTLVPLIAEKLNSEWMDVLWSLEVRIVMHSIGVYGCFLYFFRHLFRKCNGSFAGEGAKPPSQTPPPITQINEIKWNRLHESFLCISNEYR